MVIHLDSVDVTHVVGPTEVMSEVPEGKSPFQFVQLEATRFPRSI